MVLKPQDTHQADRPMGGILRQSYLPYLSSILQDREISDKMVKLVHENDTSITSMAWKTILTRRARLTRTTWMPRMTILTRMN